MRNVVAVACMLACFAGCSQTTVVSDLQKFTPQVETMSKVLTQQTLSGKSDNLRKVVNSISKDAYDILSGSFTVTASEIDAMVTKVCAKYTDNVMVVYAKPIVVAVLTFGLQTAEAEINKFGVSVADKNQIIADFVKAACKGIQAGSENSVPISTASHLEAK